LLLGGRRGGGDEFARVLKREESEYAPGQFIGSAATRLARVLLGVQEFQEIVAGTRGNQGTNREWGIRSVVKRVATQQISVDTEQLAALTTETFP